MTLKVTHFGRSKPSCIQYIGEEGWLYSLAEVEVRCVHEKTAP